MPVARGMKKRRLKRLLLWTGMISSISGLIGTVMVSVELTKLQVEALNIKTFLGIGILSTSFAAMWIVFLYSACTSRQFSIGPMAICSNCLYAMIGASLIIVAQVLPVGTMFAYTLTPKNANQQLLVGGRVSAESSSNINRGSNASDASQGRGTSEKLIWSRVTVFGCILISAGSLSAFATLAIFCRLYSKHQTEEKEELARRKLSTIVLTTWKQKQRSARVSVYDYTAWDNRTKDLFKERNNRGLHTDHETKHHDDGHRNERKTGLTAMSPLESATTFLKTAVRFPTSKSPGKDRNSNAGSVPSSFYRNAFS